jgi:hypothetical protein
MRHPPHQAAEEARPGRVFSTNALSILETDLGLLGLRQLSRSHVHMAMELWARGGDRCNDECMLTCSTRRCDLPSALRTRFTASSQARRNSTPRCCSIQDLVADLGPLRPAPPHNGRLCLLWPLQLQDFVACHDFPYPHDLQQQDFAGCVMFCIRLSSRVRECQGRKSEKECQGSATMMVNDGL